MELKKADKIPASMRESRREILNILEKFLASDEDLAEIEFDTYEDTRYLARNLYQLTYQYKYPIKVKQRSNRIFLERIKENGSVEG